MLFGSKGYLVKWIRTRQPSPGAEAYALQYGLYLPPSASRGNIYMRGLRPLAPADQVFTAAGYTVSGFGGVTAGTLAMQGLIDPNASNGTVANQ